jgi:CBS-domain-containing membrane protein
MTQEQADEEACEIELTDEDILDAMQHIPGYLDISTEDFRVIYHLAWQHALARLQARKGREGK